MEVRHFKVFRMAVLRDLLLTHMKNLSRVKNRIFQSIIIQELPRNANLYPK
jgi:hypothetical protein